MEVEQNTKGSGWKGKNMVLANIIMKMVWYMKEDLYLVKNMEMGLFYTLIKLKFQDSGKIIVSKERQSSNTTMEIGSRESITTLKKMERESIDGTQIIR